MPTKNEVSKYIAGVARRGKDLRKPLGVIALYMLRSIAKNFQAGGRPEKWQKSLSAKLTGKKTMKQGGQLRGSIKAKATAKKLTIGSNKVQARILQEGGTIKSKEKQFLTIPLAKQAVGRRAREFENTFIAKDVIFQKQGDDIIPLFALKKKVTIPPRPFIVVQKEDEHFIRRRIEDWLIQGK